VQLHQPVKIRKDPIEELYENLWGGFAWLDFTVPAVSIRSTRIE
jgi:hypothetical protein